MPGAPGYVDTPDADPRHLYHNFVIALDSARSLNNGEPVALAKWLGCARLRTGNRIYHLGCGVGYYTAIMAEVVGASREVFASEIDPELAARASKNLVAYPNVRVHSGDGLDIEWGECNAIFINAGVTHPHPKWLDSLRQGGRIVIPLTVSGPALINRNLGPASWPKSPGRRTGFPPGW
jgi:protein-L-isoaspartate(D-aspartate) O-methyltransferase